MGLNFNFRYKSVDLYDTQNPENYWIVNENKFINQLRFILKDVREFVNISGEVVILDFSSFPIGTEKCYFLKIFSQKNHYPSILGFYKHPERHAGLLHLIAKELGHFAYQRADKMVACYDLTVEEITSTNGTIMVLYPPEELPHPENGIKPFEMIIVSCHVL